MHWFLRSFIGQRVVLDGEPKSKACLRCGLSAFCSYIVSRRMPSVKTILPPLFSQKIMAVVPPKLYSEMLVASHRLEARRWLFSLTVVTKSDTGIQCIRHSVAYFLSPSSNIVETVSPNATSLNCAVLFMGPISQTASKRVVACEHPVVQ